MKALLLVVVLSASQISLVTASPFCAPCPVIMSCPPPPQIPQSSCPPAPPCMLPALAPLPSPFFYPQSGQNATQNPFQPLPILPPQPIQQVASPFAPLPQQPQPVAAFAPLTAQQQAAPAFAPLVIDLTTTPTTTLAPTTTAAASKIDAENASASTSSSVPVDYYQSVETSPKTTIQPDDDEKADQWLQPAKRRSGFHRRGQRAILPSPTPLVEKPSMGKCNDPRLRQIMLQNLHASPSVSKRQIQKAAQDELGGIFNVVCSTSDFSYLANTQLFCETGSSELTCFAFLHTLL